MVYRSRVGRLLAINLAFPFFWFLFSVKLTNDSCKGWVTRY
jgi:hypothetical protein